MNGNEPKLDRTAELTEDTQPITPIDQEFIEAAHEMELIRQLAVAQAAVDKAIEGNVVTFTGLIHLNDKRDSAIKALIAFCRDRWLTDPVYAPLAEDPANVSISGKVF